MKKLILVALLAIGLTGFAQEGKKKKGDHEVTTEMKVKKMTEELSLNADQQKQMTVVLDEQAALMKASKENPENKENNKAKMKEVRGKVKGILTPEQLEKWKANMDQNKGKRNGDHAKKEKSAESED